MNIFSRDHTWRFEALALIYRTLIEEASVFGITYMVDKNVFA
jgi:hypothetical protein